MVWVCPLGKVCVPHLIPSQQCWEVGPTGEIRPRGLRPREQRVFLALSSTPPSYPLLSCHTIPQDRGSHRVLVPVILSFPFSRTVGNKNFFLYKLSSLWYSVIAAQDRPR